jgi:beta-lactamase class D
MLVEQAPTFAIRAKTGWAARVNPNVGWYVGYVETKVDSWMFATNIDVENKANLPLRQMLTNEALKAKGIIK